MSMRIVTLCRSCVETKLAAGEKLKQYTMAKATTKPAQKCQCCGSRSEKLSMYIARD